MNEVIQEAYTRLKAGQDVVLSVIYQKTGSSPREWGTMMLVGSEGILAGTLGGGKMEYLAIEHSKEMLGHGVSEIKDDKLAPIWGTNVIYNMTDSDASNTGMVCGGINKVHFTYLDHTSKQINECLERIASYEGETPAYLIFVEADDDVYGFTALIDGKLYGCGSGLIGPDDTKLLTEAAQVNRTCDQVLSGVDETALIVPLRQKPRVLIFGGGHVSRALTVALAPLDFEVHLYEDRPEFCKPEDFALGTHCKVVAMEDLEAEIKTRAQDYIVVITRGHAFDFTVVNAFLDKPHCYIGSIGSTRKATILRRRLKNEGGYSEEKISEVFCPVGLPLGNDTPAEIAISIAAQILQVKTELTGE